MGEIMERRLQIATFSVAFTLLLTSQALVLAQKTNPKPVATKFDEYGWINGEDQCARLDNFAIQIQNLSASTALIVAYGPKGEGARVNQGNLDRIRDYLVNSRGIADSRIETLYGGRNAELAQPKIQLWIVPQGAARPKVTSNDDQIETFKGKFSDEEAWDPLPSSTELEGEGMPGVAGVTDASFADVLTEQKTAVG